MKKFTLPTLLLVLTLALSACGAGGSQAASDFKIAMTHNPNPAVVGEVELSFLVTDQAGNPVEGATVGVMADHPAMSGMGMEGEATDMGSGTYAISAGFTDSGAWKVTATVKKGDKTATQVFDIEIK